MTQLKLYVLVVALVLANFRMSAQDGVSSVMTGFPSTDSISVSILTCTPGAELYSKFGHTALRVKNHTREEDIVFNYGCFDYSEHNFVFKFLLGQTDYMLNAEPYKYLVARYGYMGTGVKEQVLNLTQSEANYLFTLLLENIRPENQEYRYIWLYDNCTERARNMIEKAVDGNVVYERPAVQATIRQMLHQCLQEDPWTCFGIDMILGAEIDEPVDKRIQMFLPDFFRQEASEAYIMRKDGSRIPYIFTTNDIIQETLKREKASFLISPIFIFSLLLLITIFLFVYEFIRNKRQEWFDIILHALQGMSGIVVAFLFFFSSHPAVDSNWLIIILNPLALFYAGWMIYCTRKRKRNILSYVNMAVLFCFLIIMLTCPQAFNTAMYLLVLALFVRALSQGHFTYHKKR